MQLRNRPHRLRIIAALAAAAFTPSCHLGPGKPPRQTEVPRLVWPAAPQRARIELVAVIHGAADLGITPTFWARLGALLGGRDEAEMVRPTGVCVSGGRIAIADPAVARVQLYDVAAQRGRVLEGCGDDKFDEPVAVAWLDGQLFVADAGRARIDVLDGAGECTGGWELATGARPVGLAADSERLRLYVADSGSHRIHAFDPQGRLLLQFGQRGDGAGELNFPTWLAVGTGGTLHVTDALNFRVQRFDPDGKPLGGFGHQGDGSGEMARPKGIGVDADGNVYLVDSLFDAVQIFDQTGRYLMVFGERGSGPGQFWLPAGLALDGDRAYVVDTYNQRLQVFRLLGGQP